MSHVGRIAMWDSLFCIIFLFDLDQHMLNGLCSGGLMGLRICPSMSQRSSNLGTARWLPCRAVLRAGTFSLPQLPDIIHGVIYVDE
jgi:hypothetical protein